MGFFDKIKTFVGVGAPTMSFTRLESRIPVTDTGVKYRLLVESEKEITVKSVTNKLMAVYRNDQGEEQKKHLISDEFGISHAKRHAKDFPVKVSKDNNWEHIGMVFMDKDQSVILQELFKNETQNKVKLLLEVTIDVVEIGELFDPTIKKEIELY